eukprot:XP_019921546.1 PREDICTED: uncharacterized protein LOC109618386 [Crassostrea gigas]
MTQCCGFHDCVMIVGQSIRRSNIDLPIIFNRSNRKYDGNHMFKGSGLRRLYHRLTEPTQPVSVVRARYIAHRGAGAQLYQDTNPTNYENPRCTCYGKTNRDRELCIFTPQPQRFTKDGQLDPVRLFKQDNLNKRLQLPLSTLVVRWQPKRHVCGYTLSDLLSVFSQFGSIQQLRLLSFNSALVVFEEIASACRVMQYPYLGDVCNKMCSSWWHRCMENKYVRMSERGIKIKTDRFVKLLL